MRCTDPTVMEFSRSDSVAGRIDLCQDCINMIAQYADDEALGNAVLMRGMHNKLFYGEANTELGEPVGLDVGNPTNAVLVSSNVVNASEEVKTVTDTIVFNCKYCDTECKTKLTLGKHEKHCEKNPNKL